MTRSSNPNYEGVVITHTDGSTSYPVFIYNKETGETEINNCEWARQYCQEGVQAMAEEITEAKVLEVLSNFQDTVMECINKAETADEKAEACHESLYRLVDSIDEHYSESVHPLLSMLEDEDVAVEKVIEVLARKLGMTMKDVVAAAKLSVSSDGSDWGSAVDDGAHGRGVASIKGNGSSRPTNEGYEPVGRHHFGRLPGF
jgi:hypothetical protein